MLVTQAAHADFRKALDALIKRDGKTVYSEVRSSAENKNCDGLLLFISALNLSAETATKHYLENSHTQSNNGYKPSWTVSLTEAEQASLINMLNEAAKLHSLKAQYDLLPIKFNILPSNWSRDRRIAKTELESLANQGYAPAALDLYSLSKEMVNKTTSEDEIQKSQNWLEKAADLGDPSANFVIGMQLLGIVDNNQKPCTASSCNPINHAKGYARLKQALEKVRLDDPLFPMGDLSVAMGDLMRKSVQAIPSDMREACLWYLYGKKNQYVSAYYSSQVYDKRLDDMSHTGELKGCVELNEARSDLKRREALIGSRQFESPTLIKQKMKSKEEPVFSIRRNLASMYQGQYDQQYIIDIYSSGQVKFRMGGYADDSNPEVLLKISPKKVEQIVSKIHRLNFKLWPLWSGVNIDDVDRVHNFTFKLKDKDGTYQIAHFINSGLTENEKLNLNQLIGIVEEIYNFQRLHCELGGINYKKECIDYNNQYLIVQ